MEVSLGAQARDPQERYQRIRGWDSLKPRAAGVLRDLAAWREGEARRRNAVSYTHLRAHETVLDIVCRLLLEKKKYTIKSC